MVRKCRPQNTEYNISSSALLLWKMANELYLFPHLFGHQIIFELLALLKLSWKCQSNMLIAYCWCINWSALFIATSKKNEDAKQWFIEHWSLTINVHSFFFVRKTNAFISEILNDGIKYSSSHKKTTLLTLVTYLQWMLQKPYLYKSTIERK